MLEMTFQPQLMSVEVIETFIYWRLMMHPRGINSEYVGSKSI